MPEEKIRANNEIAAELALQTQVDMLRGPTLEVGSSNGVPVYKYADKVGAAKRLENGNTIVWYGEDTDPVTLAEKTPATFTLVEADASPEAKALAVLNVQIPGNSPVYRALPIDTLFGEGRGEQAAEQR